MPQAASIEPAIEEKAIEVKPPYDAPSAGVTGPGTRSESLEPPIETPAGRDRRRHPRRALDLACKLFHPETGRFLSGRTSNVSTGGALIEVDGPGAVLAGDDVRVAIAWGDRTVVPMSDLVPASVVRTDDDGPDAQGGAVAIAYDRASESALAA